VAAGAAGTATIAEPRNREVADLAGVVVGAAPQPSVQDEGTADAGANRDGQDVGLSPRRPAGRLAEGEGVDVVVHPHREAEQGTELLDEGHPGPSGDGVGRRHHRPGVRIDHTRRAHPAGGGVGPPATKRPAEPGHHLEDGPRAVPRGRGGLAHVQHPVVGVYQADPRLGASDVDTQAEPAPAGAHRRPYRPTRPSIRWRSGSP
jgi:hypothetical protein